MSIQPQYQSQDKSKDFFAVDSLQELIVRLRTVFDQSEMDDSERVRVIEYLLRAYKSNPADWKKYAKFDRYRYTRNLVDIGNGRYNLMVICWGVGHGSAIHDHSDSHCFMKILHGALEEVRFDWPEQTTTTTTDGHEPVRMAPNERSRTKLDTDDVCYINDSLGLHRMQNGSNVETAVSLHLYCPPYDRCSVFSQTTGQKTIATATFYSVYGVRNKERRADEPEDN